MIGRRRRAPFLISLALWSFMAHVANADDWPQWRGPEGLGVSDLAGLPERWQPQGENIRWRTELPGDGISSPVVSNGRVFVTTAYEAPGNLARDVALRSALAIAALALTWLALARRRRGLAIERGLEDRDRQALLGAIRWVLAVSGLFSLLAILMAVRPELFLEAGNPGRSWRAGSLLALLGLAAAVGWFRPDSKARLAAAISLLLVTAYLAFNIPSGPLGALPPRRVLETVLPGLMGFVWGVFSFSRARGRDSPSPVAGFYDSRAAGLLVVMALLIFVPPNYLSGLQRVVACLDLETGQILWERSVLQAPPEQKWPRGSYATPTVAADGRFVFAYFGSGMASLDFDGNIQWSKRFPSYTGHTRYGAGASPVLTEDSVILLQESEMYQDPAPSWMASFDKGTGEAIWRIEPPEARDSYNTPLLVPTPAGTQLVTASWKKLLAFDAATGERLWSFDYRMFQIVASLVRFGDLLAVTGGAHGDKSLMVVRTPAAGSDEPPQLIWESTRTVAEVPSPLFYRGMLFTVTSGGVMTNHEAATGDVHWRERLEGEYFASLVAGDGKIYATNTEGATTVIAAKPLYREISVNQSGNGVYASPAIADGGLLIRTADELFFIEGTGEPFAVSTP